MGWKPRLAHCLSGWRRQCRHPWEFTNSEGPWVKVSWFVGQYSFHHALLKSKMKESLSVTQGISSTCHVSDYLCRGSSYFRRTPGRWQNLDSNPKPIQGAFTLSRRNLRQGPVWHRRRPCVGFDCGWWFVTPSPRIWRFAQTLWHLAMLCWVASVVCDSVQPYGV